MSEMTHRRLAYLRILDGWARLTNEIDFSLAETDEIREADGLVRDAIREYEKGAPLSIVRDAFKKWEMSWKDSMKPKVLF